MTQPERSDSGPWMYLSFADVDGFLGGCYVQLHDKHKLDDELAALTHAKRELEPDAFLVVRAVREAHRLGINPGGDVQAAGPIPRGFLEARIPPADRERLLTRAEIEAHG